MRGVGGGGACGSEVSRDASGKEALIVGHTVRDVSDGGTVHTQQNDSVCQQVPG